MGKKISLVLSGGGARGIAHIGVIEELENHGYEISSIAGTSMGALVGGIYALGKIEEFKDWLFTLDKRKTFHLVDFTIGSQGLIKGDRVLNTMKDFIPDANIEDLSIPYRAVAADLLSESEVVFSTGSVYNAIRASISIPSVLTPVKTSNQVLVDGGILNNIPVNHVQRTPNDILAVVNVNAKIPVVKPVVSHKENVSKQLIYHKKLEEFRRHLGNLRKKNGASSSGEMSFFDLINKTISTMTDRIAQYTLEQYPIDLMVEISHESSTIFDFYKAEELVEIGKLVAKESIRKQVK